MRYDYAAVAVLLFFALVYFAFFPNGYDTSAYLSLVHFIHRDGFVQYTLSWFAGVALVPIYVLNLWLAYVIAQTTGPLLAYVIVDAIAVAGMAYGAWRLGKALGFEGGKRELFLLLFIASPAFFYHVVHDRFPSMLGIAISLFALEQAYLARRLEAKRVLATSALLALAAMASVHAFLVAAIVSAYVFASRVMELARLKEFGWKQLSALAGGALALVLLEAQHALDILEFLKYSNPYWNPLPSSPTVTLDWLGPLVVAALAWSAINRVFRNQSARRAVVIAVAVAAAALLFIVGWKNLASRPQYFFNEAALVVEFIVFLAAGELFDAFAGIPRLKADFEIVFSALLIVAALTASFSIPVVKQLNPIVYVMFAAVFQSAWLARNWQPRKRYAAVAMILLSIPLTFLPTLENIWGPDSVQEVTVYLVGQESYGRVLHSQCPPKYYYATTYSGKPAVGGLLPHVVADPLLREYDAFSDEKTKQAILADASYLVRWVVSCSSAEDYSAPGFTQVLKAEHATVWERPGDYSLVEGANYSLRANEISIEAREAGTRVKVNSGYYPSLECQGCEITEKGSRYMELVMREPKARLYPREDLFVKTSAVVAASLAVLFFSLLLL